MYLYICVCGSIYIYIYIYIYGLYLGISVYIYIYHDPEVDRIWDVQTYTHFCVGFLKCPDCIYCRMTVYICRMTIYIRMYVRTYVHTCIHPYIHPSIHTYICLHNLCLWYLCMIALGPRLGETQRWKEHLK